MNLSRTGTRCLSACTRPSSAMAKHFCKGVTLVELMVTVAIIAILASVAVPAFESVMLSSRLTSMSNDFVSAVQLARNEAIKRNTTVTLCVAGSASSCGTGGWQQGWLVLDSASQVIHSRASLNTGYLLKSSGTAVTSITFQPSGAGATTAVLVLCKSTPSAGSQERTITVSATGRATITKTTTGVCT